MRRLATRWLLCSASLGGRITKKKKKNTYWSEVTIKTAQSNTFIDFRVFLMHVEGVSLSCGAVTRASLSPSLTCRAAAVGAARYWLVSGRTCRAQARPSGGVTSYLYKVSVAAVDVQYGSHTHTHTHTHTHEH